MYNIIKTKMTQQLESIQKIKIILVGESGVGKTSILKRFIHQTFDNTSQPTLGACYISKQVKLSNGQKVEYQVWDTAGQERYRSIAPIYYKQAHIALCVYDITSSNSFESMKKWISDIKTNGPADINIMIIGNKIDRCQQQQIDYQTAKQYSNRIRCPLKIVSAKQNKNIEELFIVAGDMVSKKKQVVKSSFQLTSSEQVKINWVNKISKIMCCKN